MMSILRDSVYYISLFSKRIRQVVSSLWIIELISIKSKQDLYKMKKSCDSTPYMGKRTSFYVLYNVMRLRNYFSTYLLLTCQFFIVYKILFWVIILLPPFLQCNVHVIFIQGLLDVLLELERMKVHQSWQLTSTCLELSLPSAVIEHMLQMSLVKVNH